VSPTVFRAEGFRFYFFSREEPRMHVHVQGENGEAKFWLEPQIELARNYGLSDPEVNRALRLIREKEHDIRRAGTSTSEVEVTNVSKHGFWLMIRDQEVFVPFSEFPWFRDASIGQLLNVQLPSPHHLYWPDLDVDLAVESLFHPERFPLVSRARV
jgi:hypothetical protein